MLMLVFFSWGTASAVDLPTISPADGSADVWYHIRLELRTWGLMGNTSATINDGSVKGYYFDQGRGKMLINIEDTLNVPGTQWKFVETSVNGEYLLISRLGNTIDWAETAFGEIDNDRYYTTEPGGQIFTIETVSVGGVDYSKLILKSADYGIDKGNGHLYFDRYSSGNGVAISFIPAEPLGTALIKPLDLDLGDVPVGKARTRTLTVSGINLTGNLSYSIAPEGVFTVTPGATTADGGTAEITYSPTAQQADTAVLTISIGDLSETATLTGNADFEFPVQTGDEHWYYIQFYRQAVNNKVLQANATGQDVKQTLISGGQDNQLWKIVGDWDAYRLVSKSGVELSYNTASNKYSTDDIEGNEFSFVRFGNTDDWQLRNESSGYTNAGEQSETRRFLNDYDAKGDSVSNYTINDAGNRLIFIPATTQSLIAGIETVDFGSVPTGVGATVMKKIPVGGLNISGDITATIEGAGFSLSATSLPATGGTVDVTFNPAAIDNYAAKLIFSAEGVENDTVLLKGSGSTFPFKISAGDNDYWYYIQFVRMPGKAFTNNEDGGSITQTIWTKDQEVNDAQIWKITGTWDNFKFVSKKGGELASVYKLDADGDPEYEDYTVQETGNRHIAIEKTTGTNQGWGFQNVEAKEAGRTLYMNDFGGETIGLYGYLDEGGPLKFIRVTEGPVITPNTTTIVHNDVTIGFKKESTLTVTANAQTTNPISYALSGSGAANFKVANTTADTEATAPLPAIGGTLNVSFEPDAIGEYAATLTLSSEGADDVIVVLRGYCVDYAADFPVKISDETSTTWYTVYFERRYTSGYSYRVWTGGLESEAITQTAQSGRTDATLTTEEQLWKFEVNPEKTGYLAVAHSGLVAVTGGVGNGSADYTLEMEGGTPLLFKKNTGGKWYLLDALSGGRALNDRGGNTICEYNSSGDDGGNPLGFIETALPAPVRIQIYTTSVDFGKIEAGAPAIYSSNLVVKGVGLSGNIAVSVTGDGAAAYSVIRAADSTAVTSVSQGPDTLKVIFAPTAGQVYGESTINFTAEGADSRAITLKGGAVTLPVTPSTAEAPVWYYIGFVRQSPLFEPPKAYERILTAGENDTINQIDKAAEATDAQLWRFDGTAAEGYRLVNKAGREAFYDSTSTVKSYLLVETGHRFSFVSGTGTNIEKIQLRNLTNNANGGYLCDKDNKGVYATNYSRNDGGNWLTITPLIPTAIIPVDVETNDPVISSAYYNLQGIRTLHLVRNNIYIRVDRHVSGKTTASKFISRK
jgi:hypothetical protein